MSLQYKSFPSSSSTSVDATVYNNKSGASSTRRSSNLSGQSRSSLLSNNSPSKSSSDLSGPVEPSKFPLSLEAGQRSPGTEVRLPDGYAQSIVFWAIVILAIILLVMITLAFYYYRQLNLCKTVPGWCYTDWACSDRNPYQEAKRIQDQLVLMANQTNPQEPQPAGWLANGRANKNK